jgi:hypothetical protein
MSGKNIKPVTKGGTPTLLDANKANELINAINALQNIQIRRGEYDDVVYGNSSIIIQIKKETLSDLIDESTDNFPIKAEWPIEIKKDGSNLTFILKGFTKAIKYCGGVGRFFFLRRPYNK